MFAYMRKKAKNRFFKSKDDVVSMFLGLAVVVAVGGFMVNYIEKRKGNVEIPGVINDLRVEELEKSDKEIRVAENDSLWKIAEREYQDGYKWVDIAKANNIKNPDFIVKDQKLIIPEITESEEDTVNTESTEMTKYKVVRGDSLWKIAVRVYGDGYQWTNIWLDNKSKLNSPDKLEIGMILFLRGKL